MSEANAAIDQLEFGIVERYFGPLVSVEEATCLFRDLVSRDHVIWMIEEGRLGAINIALNAEGVERHLRVWRWTIDRANYPRLEALIKRQGRPVLESLLPHRRPYFLSRELQTFLGCSDQHIANLFSAGQLAGDRLGAQRLLRISRPSLLSFLKSREFNP
jgi:hypothetical protein